MPVEKEDIVKRIEEIQNVIKNQGSEFITVDEKTLKEVLSELIDENATLKQKVEKLEKGSTTSESGKGETITVEEFVRRMGGKQNFDEKGVFKGGAAGPREYLLSEYIEEDKLKQAQKNLKNADSEGVEIKWERVKYKPLTAQIFNDFLRARGIKVKDNSDEGENLNLDKDKKNKWLESQGAYEIDEKIKKAEKDLELWERGRTSLPYFYDKCGFKIDKPDFCRIITVNEDGEEKEMIDPEVGRIIVPAGGGKSTKSINCLMSIFSNIVMVAPKTPLVEGLAANHKDWLQTWECVVHPEMDESGKNQKMVEERNDKGEVIIDDDGKPKMRRKYIHHGAYEVAENDLVDNVTRNVVDGKGEEKTLKGGLSVLKPGVLFGFQVRDKYCREKLPKEVIKQFGKTYGIDFLNDPREPNFVDEAKKYISEKLIDKKNALIVFDEGDEPNGSYRSLMFWTVKLGYKVIQMSATFEGKPFSVTSTYPKDIIYMKGISSKLNKELATGKTLVFLRNLVLTPQELKILEDAGVCYVPCDENYEASFEVVTKGVPAGALIIGDERYDRGFTPDADIVVLTCERDQTNLGPGWVYSEPVNLPISIASAVQQLSRVGRTKYGKSVLLSKEMKEVKIPKNDIASAMIEAALSGNTDKLVKVGKYNDLKDINFIRGAISLKDMFGSPPPVILIGLQGTVAHPKFGRKPKPSRPDPKHKSKMLPIDEGLWWQHENPNKSRPVSIDKDRAKELLKLMIDTFIKKEKNILEKINKIIPSPLIETVGLTVEDVRAVLNNIIEEKLNIHINDKDRNKKFDLKKMSSKSEETIEEVASLYELAAGVIIEVTQDEKKGKKKWVVKIGYPKPAFEEKKKERMLGEQEPIGIWECSDCLQVNNGDEYCDKCGLTFEEQKEKKEELKSSQDDFSAQILQAPNK